MAEWVEPVRDGAYRQRIQRVPAESESRQGCCSESGRTHAGRTLDVEPEHVGLELHEQLADRPRRPARGLCGR